MLPVIGVEAVAGEPSFAELNEERLKAIKSTVAKTVVAVMLSRSYIELIVIVRPVAFGQPIDVGHTPSCHESLLILLTVFAFASWALYVLGGKKDWWLSGLLTYARRRRRGRHPSRPPHAPSCPTLPRARSR